MKLHAKNENFLYFADFTKNHVPQLVEMSIVWYLNEVSNLRWYCPTNGPKISLNTFQHSPMLKLTLVKKWRFISILQIFDNALFLKCPIYGVFTLSTFQVRAIRAQ